MKECRAWWLFEYGSYRYDPGLEWTRVRYLVVGRFTLAFGTHG